MDVVIATCQIMCVMKSSAAQDTLSQSRASISASMSPGSSNATARTSSKQYEIPLDEYIDAL